MYTVLYVDDDPNLLEVARVILESSGDFSVATSALATDALKRSDLTSYDVIISDYDMPQMDGITFLKKIRETHNDIPFIIFTGKGREEIVIEAINNGADFYLQKGGDPTAQFAELSNAIRHAVTRKNAEKALSESQKRYRLLLRNVNDAVYVHEVFPDRLGKFLEVNDLACQMLGYSRDELLRMNVSDIDVPEQAERLPVILSEIYRSGRAIFETEHLTKNGHRIPVEVSTHFFDCQGIPTILSTVRDITDRKRAEETIHESERRFRQMFNTLPIGMWIADKNGTLVMGNPAGREIWEADAQVGLAEYRAFKAWHLPSEEPVDPDESALYYAMSEGRITKKELLRIEAFDGSHKYILNWASPLMDETGAITGAFVLNQDITDTVKAEWALQESEERLRIALDATNDGIWDWNIPTGKTFFSPNFYTMLGYDPDELPASCATWRSLVHPEDLEGAENEIQKHLDRKTEDYSVEFRMLTKQGKWKWIVTKGKVVVRDADGNPVRMVGKHTISEC
ncbi:MAG: PAS domain-containing protein [Methanoregula sp.]